MPKPKVKAIKLSNGKLILLPNKPKTKQTSLDDIEENKEYTGLFQPDKNGDMP